VALSACQRGGLACLAMGLAWAALVQVMAPAYTPPLYDGVVPVDAYRWLSPPPGRHGGAQGASSDVPVTENASPLVAIATPEQPPQAQIFAAPGSFTLPPGTTSLRVAIAPIPAVGTPANGHIVGNVYRMTIETQDGTPLTAPESARVSVVMRAPEEVFEANLARYQAGSWQPIKTSPAGLGGTFLAIVTGFGDFALVEGGPPRSFATARPDASARPPGGGTGTSLSMWLVLVVGLGLAAGAAALLFVTTRRRGAQSGPGRLGSDRSGTRPGAGGRGAVPRKGGGRKGRPGRRR
jgi:hypothetical protein